METKDNSVLTINDVLKRMNIQRLFRYTLISIAISFVFHWSLGAATILGFLLGIVFIWIWSRVRKGQNKMLLIFVVPAMFVIVIPNVFEGLIGRLDVDTIAGGIDGPMISGFAGIAFLVGIFTTLLMRKRS